MNRFSEKDWKIFRSKIADWQETYMDKLKEGAITMDDFSDDLKDMIGHFTGN